MSEYRINGFEQIKAFYSWVFNNPDKVRPTHISLYLFLLNQGNRANWVEWFKCPYDLAMQGSCIGNNGTYYKCLDELKKWKLIDYKKGLNNFKAPLIKLFVLYKSEQLTEQVTVPLSEQLTEQVSEQQCEQLTEQLPAHIYKLITNNIKLITDNEVKFEKFIESLKVNINKVNKSKEEKKKTSFDFSNFDENFIEHVNSWLEYKKERKEPYKSQKGLNAFYNKLIDCSKNDPDTAKKIIEQSMANNWAGIFELKESQQKNKDPFYREPIVDRTHGFSVQF